MATVEAYEKYMIKVTEECIPALHAMVGEM